MLPATPVALNVTGFCNCSSPWRKGTTSKVPPSAGRVCQKLGREGREIEHAGVDPLQRDFRFAGVRAGRDCLGFYSLWPRNANRAANG